MWRQMKVEEVHILDGGVGKNLATHELNMQKFSTSMPVLWLYRACAYERHVSLS